jgi:hypothetical protein
VSEPGPPAARASDEDREHTVALLREASVDGRLTLEELADRTERAQLARTRPDLAELTADLPAAAPARAAAPDTERNHVLFSAHARRGRWRPARSSRYLNVCGTLDLDLRQAVLPGPEIDLAVTSWFGTTTVLVPEGVEVELTGGGLGATRRVEVEGTPGPDAPVVRVRTRGPFGTVRVRSRPR